MSNLLKYILVLSVSVLLSYPQVFAQDDDEPKTLFNLAEADHGGYGGLRLSVTQINGETGLFVGGYGGYLLNHTLMIGGGGYGLVSNIKADPIAQTNPDKTLYVKMGYGGPMLQYLHNSKDVVHFVASLLIGAGGVTYALKDDYEALENNSDSFFVLEPGLELEANIIKFFRIRLGVSYRFVSGIELEGLTDDEVSGATAQLSFLFGYF